MTFPEGGSPLAGGAGERQLGPETDIEQLQARLGELLAMSPETAAVQATALQAVTDRVLASTSSPQEQEIARLLHDVFTWQLCGQPGDPLPEGLVHTSEQAHHDSDLEIPAIRYNLFLTENYYGGVGSVVQAYRAAGVDQVETALRQDVATREPAVRATFEKLAEVNPAYQLIRSFLVKAPQLQDRAERPLPPVVRAFRERVIENSLLASFRLAPGEHIARGDQPEVGMIFRAQRRLDNETIRQPVPAPASIEATRAAQAYFLQPLADEAEGFGARFTHGRMELTRHGSEDYILCTEQQPDGYSMDGLISAASNAWARELAGSNHNLVGAISYEVIRAFLEQLIVASPHTAFEDILAGVKIGAVKALYEEHFYGESFVGHNFNIDAAEQNTRLLLGRPEGAFVDNDDLYQACRRSERLHGALGRITSFGTAAEFAERQNMLVGNVDVMPPYDSTPRLIQSQPYNDKLPAFDPQTPYPAYLIELLARRWDKADPFIPGLQLVSRRGIGEVNRYGFRRAGGHDPYAAADIALPGSKLDLAARYQAIGLTELAAALPDRAETIQDLVDLIFEHLFYPYPQTTALYGEEISFANLPAYFYAEALEDYAQLVGSGLLYAQCEPICRFIGLSLDALFGPGKTGTTSGYCFTSTGLLSEVDRHRQATFLNDDGKLYILDGVARFGGERPPVPNLKERWGALYAAPRPPRPPRWWPRVRQHRNHLSLTPAQEIASLKQTLEGQLQIIAHSDDSETLYRKIIALPDADPLRLTVETVLRAHQQVPPLHAPELLLEDLRQAEQQQRYDASLVALLRHTARRLQQLLAKDDSGN